MLISLRQFLFCDKMPSIPHAPMGVGRYLGQGSGSIILHIVLLIALVLYVLIIWGISLLTLIVCVAIIVLYGALILRLFYLKYSK